MDVKKDKIEAVDIVETFVGNIGGLVFKVVEEPSTFYDPGFVEIEYIEGEEFIPEDVDIEDFEDVLLARVGELDYDVPDDVQEKMNGYLEEMDRIHAESVDKE